MLNKKSTIKCVLFCKSVFFSKRKLPPKKYGIINHQTIEKCQVSSNFCVLLEVFGKPSCTKFVPYTSILQSENKSRGLSWKLMIFLKNIALKLILLQLAFSSRWPLIGSTLKMFLYYALCLFDDSVFFKAET